MRSDPEPTDVGFTLLELMVVLAILLVIAGFAVPALTTLSGGNGLSSGGRIVANLLTVARSEAINRHASIRFRSRDHLAFRLHSGLSQNRVGSA